MLGCEKIFYDSQYGKQDQVVEEWDEKNIPFGLIGHW